MLTFWSVYLGLHLPCDSTPIDDIMDFPSTFPVILILLYLASSHLFIPQFLALFYFLNHLTEDYHFIFCTVFSLCIQTMICIKCIYFRWHWYINIIILCILVIPLTINPHCHICLTVSMCQLSVLQCYLVNFQMFMIFFSLKNYHNHCWTKAYWNMVLQHCCYCIFGIWLNASNLICLSYVHLLLV